MRGLNEIRRMNLRVCVHCVKEEVLDQRIESRDDCYKCSAIANRANYGNEWSFARSMAEAEKA
jgi:hypothetical protein